MNAPATPKPAAGDVAPWESKRGQPPRLLIRRTLPWLGLAALVALVVWGLKPRPIEVETATLTRGPLTVHVVEEGKTRIRNRYVLSAPLAGQMRRVPLKAGDPVVAGQTLVTTIEPAAAPLLDPRSETQAKARIEMMEAARKQTTENLEMVRTSAKFAQSQWKRMQQLGQSGGVSAIDLDNAERDALMREREVHAAEFAVQVAEYEWTQAKAALLQLQASDAGPTIEIRAPVTGNILKVFQESTTVVAPGTPIIEIGDTADIEIEAEILSRDAVAIRPGAMVSIEQWGGEAPLQGRVRRVEPAAFTKISALGVEEQRVIVLSDLVEPPADARLLGDRYRVEVRVAVWHGDDVPQVPAGALFREGNTWKTFVFDNGTARKTTVDAGHTDGRQTEILGGLPAGATVLVHPPDTIEDGAPVVKRAR